MDQWELMEHEMKKFENPPHTGFITKMIISIIMISSLGKFYTFCL